MPKRVRLVPVSCESIERLQSRQKTTTFGGSAETASKPKRPSRGSIMMYIYIYIYMYIVIIIIIVIMIILIVVVVLLLLLLIIIIGIIGMILQGAVLGAAVHEPRRERRALDAARRAYYAILHYFLFSCFFGGGERQTAKSQESRPFISLGLVYPLPQPLISNRP